MSHEPFFNMQPYLPDDRGMEQAPGGPSRETALAQNFSIDTLVSNRRRILETKFEVFADLIKKRIEVRQVNLQALLEDEMKLRTLRHRSPEYFVMTEHQRRPGLVPLEQALLKIEEERRNEERVTWSDLVPVVRDLLSTWEALEQAKARAIFLKSQSVEETARMRRGEDLE